MLSPHALAAGLATFVWCLLLFGVAPFMAAKTVTARRPSVVIAAPKHFDRYVATQVRTRKATTIETATTPEAPKSKKKHAWPPRGGAQ